MTAHLTEPEVLSDLTAWEIPQRLSPASALVEELKEEEQLALASHGSVGIPLGVEETSRGVQRPGDQGWLDGATRLTQWVSLFKGSK